MVVLVALVRRREGMDAAAFHAYWRDRHGPLVAEVLGHHLHRYEQHPLIAGVGGFDGVAMMWFDSPSGFDDMISDPQYAAVVGPDEAQFLDPAATQWVLADAAHFSFDGAAG